MNVFQYSLEHYIIRVTEHALRLWNTSSFIGPSIDYIIDIRDDIHDESNNTRMNMNTNNFHPNGIHLNGILTDGILADGIHPNGILTDGILADGILADGIHPSELLSEHNINYV
jgi:hypothetical protein